MATSSIGQVVKLDTEMAKKIVEASKKPTRFATAPKKRKVTFAPEIAHIDKER